MIEQRPRLHPLHIILICVFLFLFLAAYLVNGLRSSSEQAKEPSAPSPRSAVTTTPQQALVPGKDYQPGHVTVKFKQSATSTEIQNAIAENSATVINQIPEIGVTVLQVAFGQENTVIDALTQQGLVEYAELDYLYEDHAFTPNDTDFTKQYGLLKIHAPEAWDITRGKGVVIANIQNQGADVNHPDLKANIQTGSGSIDHGTHTSGIIAAVTNNAVGVAGTCPECKLIIQNVAGYTATNIAKAVTTSADSGAKVINMSFGGAIGAQAQKDAMAYAWGKGVVIVASAGNDGVSTLQYPAAYPNVVSVGATDANDAKASYSNFGTWVKIAAPGDKILSTLAGGKYGLMSGTSMAAPMMAGVFGLIWSSSYGTSADAVVKRACDTSDKIAGTGTNWTCGRVNAFAAVQGSTGAPQAVPSSVPGPVTPTFFPIATCPTCSTQSTPSPASNGSQTIDPATGEPVVGNPLPSGAFESPDVSGTPGHAGQKGGLITIILAFFALILQFIMELFGQ